MMLKNRETGAWLKSIPALPEYVVYMYNNRCLYINTAGIIVLTNFAECIFFDKNVYCRWRELQECFL